MNYMNQNYMSRCLYELYEPELYVSNWLEPAKNLYQTGKTITQ